MLKQSALRRIMVSTIALLIVSILYFFPNNKFNQIETNIEYQQANNTPIYLLNKDNYIVMSSCNISSNEPLVKAKELINALTIDSGVDNYPSSKLNPIIPKNTKLLSIDLNNNLLKVNFSKDFLNVDKKNEEKLIEALVYTLTEISEVKEIMIFIENSKLEVLPASNIHLPNTLNRSFGINKVYDITNIKNLTKTTIYYVGKEDDLIYYIPVTKIDNNLNNKIEIIIEELKSSPIYETNLHSFLASSVELLNYETLENAISLSFNNKIFDDFNSRNIQEEVKYSISLSVKDTLNVENVIFKVDNEIVATLKENQNS